jgi:DNA repair ATPase RecN
VIYLTHKLGVNLAGVEMILKLQKKIKRMQDEMNRVFKETEGEFEQEKQSIRDDIKKQAERLVGIRRDNASKVMDKLAPLALPGGSANESVATKRVSKKKSSQAVEPEVVHDDFEIEYDKDE